MSDEETIHVADVSEGVGGDPDTTPGDPVDIPVVELLTGRGFVTGKSGSGKSNTASVVIENLLDNNFPVLIVDTDGEYYGLKEEYEILHAGADEECDIVVSPEHAEKIATLALDQNVPIILDVSGYLEEDTANELLLEVVKQLFAKEKKMKKPFLLVLEECHEYIPEGGGMDETGKMLIKVGKRGRKHGLGIVGISQRPADVKKDFITQCDWLCWHRLTWDNDTKVVSRILGSEYADAIEDMGDGEAFLMSDWDESIRRIQFHRKQTFDAGATPGLDDFERPELKSVSGNLVSELETISEEQERRESELADLQQELDKKRAKINQLEQELEDARDLSNMADQFAQALLGRAEAPYRGGSGGQPASPASQDQAALDEYDAGEEESGEAAGASDANDASDTADGDSETGTESVESGDGTDPVASDDSGAEDAPAVPEADSDAGETATADRDDVDPVSRADVAEEALRFDAEMELGTRKAVIEELRERVAELPEMSTAMLRHYRRQGVSEPIAAHIDAGGDGDAEHAYARHRPIRKSGLIRHADRGQYEYAIPALIREAYANRLGDTEVAQMVAEVEEAFVPPGELDYPDEDPMITRNGEPAPPTDAESGESMASEAAANDGGSESEGDPRNERDDDSDGSDDPLEGVDRDSIEVDEFAGHGLSETAKKFARAATGRDPYSDTPEADSNMSSDVTTTASNSDADADREPESTTNPDAEADDDEFSHIIDPDDDAVFVDSDGAD
ncbi:MAG: helicase HerA domain-containing protein [Halopenitus sp.]